MAENGYRVCRSNGRIAVFDFGETLGNAAHIEVYEVRFWDSWMHEDDFYDYELQKFADVYASTLSEMENIVHCFGVVWTPIESFNEALDELTEDYLERRNRLHGSRSPIVY